MEKIKIAHVINSIGLGGVTTAVYNFLKEIPKENYILSLYCMKPYNGLSDLQKEYAECFKKLGVNLSFPSHDKKGIDIVGELCRWTLNDKIDILHTHSYKPNIYGRLAGVLCNNNIKLISHYHNYYDDKCDGDNSLIFEQLLTPFSDQLITCSESVRNYVSKKIDIPSSKIIVIYHGVDTDKFNTRYHHVDIKNEMHIPLDRKVVGIVGRITEQKAQDDFIQAAKLIKESVPGAIFLIVGSASNDTLLSRSKHLIRELDLENDIIFTGHIADVHKVYSILDILVVPSRWEGFGLILVEAMACGTPIVAANVGPIPEVVTQNETALLVPPNSPTSIAKNVVTLLQNPDLAEKMGQSGIKRAKMFSWQKASMQLVNVYKTLLGLARNRDNQL